MRSSHLTGSIHDVLSRRVLLPLAAARQLARPATRPAMVAFFEGLRFRTDAGAWSEEERRAWVHARLQAVVRRAAIETDYYRQLFERVGFDPHADFTFEDFAQLPALDRQDVARAAKCMISSAVPPEQLRRDATGGSTGVPTEVWLGPAERGWRDSGTEFFMRRLGLPAGSRTAYLWGHHLDPVAQDGLRDRYRAFESNTRWFDCFRLSADVLERYHQTFQRVRPACIIAYAGALGALAEHLREADHRPDYPTSGFVTGAEKLWPEHRALIERVFGRPVHERYGGRDVGGIAFQLTPTSTLDYTVDWANVLIEPETAEQDAPILATKLHADVMPILRYRLGDIGRFPAGSRPGHPSFTLHEVLGRAVDRIWLRDGRWLHGNQLPHLMKDYPVREFMFQQRADYSVELQVVPRAGYGEHTRQDILRTVKLNLADLDVQITAVESIPRTKSNKWRPVVSEVDPLQVKHV